jgi:hypothetical protein
MNNDEFRYKIFEFVVEEVNINNPIELDGNPIKIVNINDDTGNFPRETDSLLELIAETEKMIREGRKNELRKLVYNHGLKQETYYLINRQFEKQITLHPPKCISEKLFL